MPDHQPPQQPPRPPAAGPPSQWASVASRKTVWRMLKAEGVLLLAGVAAMVTLLVGSTSGISTFVLAIVLAFLPVPVYVSLVVWADQYEPEGPRALAWAFAWGAGIATGGALLLNGIGYVFAVGITGPYDLEAAEAISAVFVAPVTEEALKAAALIWIATRRTHLINGVLDGVVYATMVALGFAAVENVLYYATAAADDGTGAAVATFVGRGIITPFAHPIFTSVTGVAVGWQIKRGKSVWSLVTALGLAGAMVLHGLWNFMAVMIESAATSDEAAAASIIGLGFVVLFGTFIAFLWIASRRERKILRQYLAIEVETGVLSDDDLSLLLSRWRRMWTGITSAVRGLGPYLVWSRFQQAAGELAHAHRTTILGPVAGRPTIARPIDVLRQRLIEAQASFVYGVYHVIPDSDQPPSGPPRA